MKFEVKKLIKETYIDYFSGRQKELITEVPVEYRKEYVEGMLRLETDFEFQKQIGITC